jgi:phosphatidate cytidylyltransferase
MTLAWLLGLTFATLVTATAAGQILRCVVHSDGARATVANANVRIGAWWVLCGLMALALAAGGGVVVVVFAGLSCLAVREFAALSEHRRLPLYSLWMLTAVQYALIPAGWYDSFSAAVPVIGLFYFPVRAALRAETGRFLEQTAGAAWCLSACAYGVSHAPTLLVLSIPGYEGRNGTLLFYYLLVVQSSDVFQYCWGKLAGRRLIAPHVSPNKTWEGFLGGILSSTVLGALLYAATPFRMLQAAAICAAITLAGFAGGLVMSAIKRDRGVKDFGTIVSGHGGVLDRLDSICFSAPLFYYLVKYFFAA